MTVYATITSEGKIFCNKIFVTSNNTDARDYYGGVRTGLQTYNNGNYVNSAAGTYNQGWGMLSGGPGYENISFQSNGYVLSSTGFGFYSDKRIKKNIKYLESNISLNIVENIKPVSFNYIDYINSGIKTKYGFIAQEISQYIPESIIYGVDNIPNIFENVDISYTIITLNATTTTSFEKNVNDKPIKLKFYDISNNILYREIIEIIDDKKFIINEPIQMNENKIFLYGQEVYDFHTLDDSQIQSITCSAVQELNKIIKLQQNKIDELEKKIDFLMSKI